VSWHILIYHPVISWMCGRKLQENSVRADDSQTEIWTCGGGGADTSGIWSLSTNHCNTTVGDGSVHSGHTKVTWKDVWSNCNSIGLDVTTPLILSGHIFMTISMPQPLHPEDGGSMALQNIGVVPHPYIVSRPRRRTGWL